MQAFISAHTHMRTHTHPHTRADTHTLAFIEMISTPDLSKTKYPSLSFWNHTQGGAREAAQARGGGEETGPGGVHAGVQAHAGDIHPRAEDDSGPGRPGIQVYIYIVCLPVCWANVCVRVSASLPFSHLVCKRIALRGESPWRWSLRPLSLCVCVCLCGYVYVSVCVCGSG